MDLTVIPEELVSTGAVIESMVAEVATQVAVSAQPITAVMPAGVGDASLLASVNFATHGANFLAQAAAAASLLASGAAAMVHAGTVYRAQENANTSCSDDEDPMPLDALALPPEINVGRLISGASVVPMQNAQMFYTNLSATYVAEAQKLAMLMGQLAVTFHGPSAVLMQAAYVPYIASMHFTAEQLGVAAVRAQAQVGAYVSAVAAMPTLPELAALQTQHATLVATNPLVAGANTPAIVANEAAYAAEWARAATVQSAYFAATAVNSAFEPFAPAPPITKVPNAVAEGDRCHHRLSGNNTATRTGSGSPYRRGQCQQHAAVGHACGDHGSRREPPRPRSRKDRQRQRSSGRHPRGDDRCAGRYGRGHDGLEPRHILGVEAGFAGNPENAAQLRQRRDQTPWRYPRRPDRRCAECGRAPGRRRGGRRRNAGSIRRRWRRHPAWRSQRPTGPRRG